MRIFSMNLKIRLKKWRMFLENNSLHFIYYFILEVYKK